MKVEEKQSRTWSDVGRVLEFEVDAAVLDDELEGELTLHLEIDEVLEKFEGRRVLAASAQQVEAEDIDVDDEIQKSALHPTYLIEETSRVEEDDREWSEDVDELVRAPVSVEVDGELKRSVFVDNVGVSVGDLLDLVRGRLDVDQVDAVFSAVGELFVQLHERGWAHLGLTPWNIRVFDHDSDDGFPRGLLASSLGKSEATPVTPGQGADESDDAVDGEASSNEEEPSFLGDDRTVVELQPLGVSEQEQENDGSADENGPASRKGDEASTGLLAEDSDLSWSELEGDTSALEKEREQLAALLDGIDRLYRSDEIDDEVAVTPGFSAPELLSGMGSDDGKSADVFSLGMLLYFLVAGVVPPASVYTRYAPAIPARNFRPDFPPGLQSVIARATRPRPEDRYASVRSMLNAFEDACEVMRRRAQSSVTAAPTMNLASDTHIGIAKKKRNPTNQDNVFSASSDDDRCALVVVADGVSTASYGSGDLASAALVEEAKEVWEETLPAYLMDEELEEVEIIQEILTRANRRIVEHVNEHYTPFRGSPHEVMGSTALVAVIIDGLVTLGSLGDSRVYLQRGAEMEQVTIDHNLWTLSILEGVEADSALAMPHGDALARCLGTFVVENGRLEEVEPQPDVFQFQLIENDTLLLTTDGLVDFAGPNLLTSEDNILSILLAEPNPDLACLELILLANRGGGGDNIGLSVVRFE